jgi:hypothetical protein
MLRRSMSVISVIERFADHDDRYQPKAEGAVAV